MLYRDATIERKIRQLGSLIGIPWITIGIYLIFSPFIVVIEEIVIAFQTYVEVRKVAKIMAKNEDSKTIKPFQQLSIEYQKAYEDHYEQESIRNTRRLQIMARESSVQLTYQNALVMYEFFYPPVYALDFNSWQYPSARWMVGLVLQIVSILLSGYSTFNAIIENMKLQSHVKGKPAGFSNYLIKVLQVLCHVLIATGAVFLLLGHKDIFYMIASLILIKI